MIAKPYVQKPQHPDPRLQAGDAAEGQMAHYLHRKFAEDPDVQVLHDLRLEDQRQTEHDAAPGVCQIDHLPVHRWGMFIVESKTVSEEVRVRPDGSGGDEWSRLYKGREEGMASPIQQAKRQSAFLRDLLHRHRRDLVGRVPVGVRALARAVRGSDQRGFKYTPIQLVVAVSDRGMIRCLDGWEEPQKPFRTFVSKADQVPEKIAKELEKHRVDRNPLRARLSSKYGLWQIEREEAVGVADFLAERHAESTHAHHDRANRDVSYLKPR